jgi:hypothetical protein
LHSHSSHCYIFFLELTLPLALNCVFILVFFICFYSENREASPMNSEWASEVCVRSLKIR